MNKFIRYIQNYLICALPFVIDCMVWKTIQPDIQFGKSSSIIAKILWELLSWNLMLWFAFLVVFLISLVAIKAHHEQLEIVHGELYKLKYQFKMKLV